MRFSLKWMLGAVAFVGFGCTALYNATLVWADATMGVTTFVLLAVILGSIYLRPRAFYIGMCVFDWGYVLLSYSFPLRDSVTPLATTDALLDALYKTMQHEIRVDHVFNQQGVAMPSEDIPEGGEFFWTVMGTAYRMPIQKHFRAIGHSLFALLFAIIGGVVGQWFSRGAKCDSP